MTLVASGNISIANATSNRSIRYEVRCNTGGYSLTQLSLDAGKGANHAMTEFYGHSGALGTPNASNFTPSKTCQSTTQCSCTTPPTTASCSNSPGSCVESYSWAHESGDNTFIIDSQSSATTTFTMENIVCGDRQYLGVYRCTMTHSGASSQTVDVTVTAENLTKTGCL